MRISPATFRTARRIAQLIVRLSIAALVLVTSFETPVLQHAHANGGDPHRHAEEAHTHGSAAAPVHRHCRHHGTQVVLNFPAVEGVTAHVHVFWLGCEFTLPADWTPQSPGTHNESDPNSGSGIPTGAVCNGCVIYQLDAGAHQFSPTVNDQPLVPLSWEVCDRFCLTAEEAFVAPLYTAISTPLCDVARHERSGVQLV